MLGLIARRNVDRIVANECLRSHGSGDDGGILSWLLVLRAQKNLRIFCCIPSSRVGWLFRGGGAFFSNTGGAGGDRGESFFFFFLVCSSLNAFTRTGKPFLGQIYLKLVQGGVKELHASPETWFLTLKETEC